MRTWSRLALRAALAVCVTTGVASVVVSTAPAAKAVTAADWQPGNIISDALFYDSATMNAAQVQSFLNSKYTGCATGYTCIRDYRVSVPSRPAESGLCQGYTAASSQTAAQIIANVAVSCGVNPQALLVLIQKESGTITSQSPSYTQVTGYGCPDTTGCDSQYYGLFNQVYLAARQFKRYRLYPTQYGYVAGRSNYILYNPNTSCGGSNVYIVNQATAGLYDYTPYQPNGAALANLYGTGNSCSAYGNRNFWVYFNQWFGSTQAGSYLMRTPTDPTVYLVVGSVKHPLADLATMQALPPSFGSVLYVAQSYLDLQTTGVTLGRFIRGSNGMVYFFDAATKFVVASCAMVSDFASSCPNSVVLPDDQMAQFVTGPPLSDTVTTTSGRTYYVTGGVKREGLDAQSLAAAGAPSGSVTLADSALASIPLGPPAIRDGVAIRNRSTGALGLYSAGALYPIATSTYSGTAVGTAVPVAGSLDPASITQLPSAPALSGFATDPNGNAFVLTAAGKYAIPTTTGWGVAFTAWPSAILGLLATQAAPSTPVLVKPATAATTYAIGDGAKYVLSSWATGQALTRSGSPTVIPLLPEELTAIPTGPHALLAAGSLVKSATSPTVSLVDGFNHVVRLGSFRSAAGLGLTTYSVVDGPTLAAYATSPGLLSPAIACGGTDYVTLNATMRAVAPSQLAYYGLTYVPLDPLTCRDLPATVGSPLSGPIYVKGSAATVYQLASGTLRPLASYAQLLSLNGGKVPPLAQFEDSQLAGVPVGPVLT